MQMTMITPSFAPDFERCRLLSESVNQFVPDDIEHVLLVDQRDEQLFKRLANHRTRVMTVESVLPWWIRRMPMSNKWWFSMKSQPVRNWMLQQVVKLGVGEHIESESYMFVDSDVTFIRPLSPDSFEQDGQLALHRVPGVGQTAMHARWHQAAAKLLGFYPTNYFGANYVGNLITWRRDNLLKMYRHIEQYTGMNWMTAICRQWHLSEYILYGVFTEHVLNSRGHYNDDVEHCHISWDRDISTEEGLDGFFNAVSPENVAIMVSSKQHVPVSRYEARMKQVSGQFASHLPG